MPYLERMLAVLALLDSLFVSTHALQTLTFGGQPLRPQSIPAHLHQYHEDCLRLSEAALASDRLQCVRNVAYGPDGHHVLDLWRPTNVAADAMLPVVVWLHGGGWEWGYKEWAGLVAPGVCAQQALLVTPSYQIGEGKRLMWPSCLEDTLLALAWLHQNAPAHGGDPSRLILAGHSAGGHIAAAVGLQPGRLRAAGLPPSALRALLLLSCPLGVRPCDFRPVPYERMLPSLRAVIDSDGMPSGDASRLVAAAAKASPLVCAADALACGDAAEWPHFIHYAFGTGGDFPLCEPHAEALRRLLEDAHARHPEANERGGGDDRIRGRRPGLRLLRMAGLDHFGTHTSLAQPAAEWYDDALRPALGA